MIDYRGEEIPRLETDGIYRLARENKEVLYQIIKENFLPPPQLICAIEALEDTVEDRKDLLDNISFLLEHYASSVREASMRALGIGGLEETFLPDDIA